MTKKPFYFLCFISLLLMVFNCANRGNPSGGEKDSTPPVIRKTSPENFSVNFNSDEIVITFDEYVKIKNIQKNLIISPPMDPGPVITPLGGASKEIKIRIIDTLSENTTYAINFGESIVDNNEENPYPYYRYVFSTGTEIDSLSVTGSIMDALELTTDQYISVMLYEVDSTYSDSLIFKEKPRYITNTLDSTTTFTINNIKAGTYKLVAMKDENSNYTFQPAQDKIGFVDQAIQVPTDTTFMIKLFKEELDFKVFSPRMESGQKITIGHQGKALDVEMSVLNEGLDNIEFRQTKASDKDSIYYWYRPKIELDSILLEVRNNTYIDSFTVRIRDMQKDTLEVKAARSGTLNFDDTYEIGANVPIEEIDQELISLMAKDSSLINFQMELDSLMNVLKINFEKSENNSYKLQLLPGALKDFFGDTNDTLNYSIRTKSYADYGNMRVQLVNAQYPSIVELVNSRNEVERSFYATRPETIDFENLEPGLYQLRVIHDENGNGKYDTGNFLKGIQPEKVVYYPTPADTEVRASWGNIVTFTLQD